ALAGGSSIQASLGAPLWVAAGTMSAPFLGVGISAPRGAWGVDHRFGLLVGALAAAALPTAIHRVSWRSVRSSSPSTCSQPWIARSFISIGRALVVARKGSA